MYMPFRFLKTREKSYERSDGKEKNQSKWNCAYIFYEWKTKSENAMGFRFS